MQAKQILSVVLLMGMSLCVFSRSLPELSRSRVKRQYADMQISKHQVDRAMGPLVPRACKEAACGLYDPRVRWKRSGSDQRMAELQALMAINGNSDGGDIAHGFFDPQKIGKRKRSDDVVLAGYDEYEEIRRLALLQRLLHSLDTES